MIKFRSSSNLLLISSYSTTMDTPHNSKFSDSLRRLRAVLEGPEEGGAADRERGGVGAEHDLVQQLGVDDTVPALGALGVAGRGEGLVFVLEIRRAKIQPPRWEGGFPRRPRGRGGRWGSGDE